MRREQPEDEEEKWCRRWTALPPSHSEAQGGALLLLHAQRKRGLEMGAAAGEDAGNSAG